MTWVDGVLLATFVVGLLAGGYLVARSPAFWVGLALVIFTHLKPYLTKPLSPDNQKKLDQIRRRAEEWDFARKRAKEDHH